jgi:hypothetical protein
LVGAVREILLLAAKAEDMAQKQPRGVIVRIVKAAFCASLLGKAPTPWVSLSPKPWKGSGLK